MAAASIPPPASTLTLYHAHNCRSSRVIMFYIELRAALLACGREPPPPLAIVRFKDVDAFRNTDYDWYLAINPNGKVPTLVDSAAGDQPPIVMWDSCAICSYLLEQYDRTFCLQREDAAGRALYHQLSYYLSGTIDNLAATSSPVQRAVHIAADAATAEADAGAKQQAADNAAAAAAHAAQLNRIAWNQVCAPVFERQLALVGGGPFLCGAQHCAIDVLFTYSLRPLDDKMVALTGESWISPELHPLVAAYAARNKQRVARRLAFSPLESWTNEEMATHGLSWKDAPQ
jgi:glutathione S-transferase